MSLSRAGQRARLSFAGTAGQRVSVRLTSLTIADGWTSVLNPDGSVLGSPWNSFIWNPFIEPLTLPTTGTYQLLLDPTQAYTGGVTVTLYDVPADVTGAVVINDPAATVTIPVPGQQAALSMAGTASQAITVRGHEQHARPRHARPLVVRAADRPSGCAAPASARGSRSRRPRHIRCALIATARIPGASISR